MPDLDYLELNGNNISDVTALGSLTRLTDLRLDDNSVTDFAALQSLVNLRYLNLSSNSISDLAPLVANAGIGDGDAVIVTYNPLDCEEQSGNLSALEERGVILTSDCP